MGLEDLTNGFDIERDLLQLKAPEVEVYGDNVAPKERTLEDMGIRTTPKKLPDVPTEPSVIISDLLDVLVNARSEGGLSPQGEEVYQAIVNGAFTDASLATLMQGATLGFSDEAIAGIRQLTNKSEFEKVSKALRSSLEEGGIGLYGGQPVELSPYEVSAGIERLQQKQFSDEYPIGAPAMEFGAGVLTGGTAERGLEKLFGKKTVPSLFSKEGAKDLTNRTFSEKTPTLSDMIGKGMIYGGLAGYGYGEGSPAEQATSAGLGFGLGGASGGALYGLGIGAEKLAKKTIDLFTPETVTESNIANKLIKDVLKQEFGSVDEALVEFGKRATGKDFTLADLGNNTRLLLDISRMIPSVDSSTANKFFNQRRMGQMTRLQTDAKKAFGKTGEIFSEIKAINQAKSKLGGNMYKESFSIPVNAKQKFQFNVQNADGSTVLQELNLNDMLKLPQFQDAFNKAQELASMRGVKDFAKYKLDKNGNVKVGKKNVDEIPTEFLHWMKMGLDRTINAKGIETGYDRQVLSTLYTSKKQFLTMLDSNKSYKNARNFYAGLIDTENAYLAGQKMFSQQTLKNLDDVFYKLDAYSSAEKEAFRSGAVRAIMDTLGGAVKEGEEMFATRDFTKLFFNDPRKMRILRETFGDNPKGFEKFKRNLQVESQMYETYRVMQGSQTFPREMAYKQFYGNLYDIDRNMDMLGLLRTIFLKNQQNISERQASAIATDVTNMLTTFKKKDLEVVVNRLKDSNPQKVVDYAYNLLNRARNTAMNPYALGNIQGQAGAYSQERFIPNPDPNFRIRMQP